MESQKNMIVLRKEIPKLYKNWLNIESKTFAKTYQQIEGVNVDFPRKEMDRNLEQMGSMLAENESIIEIKTQNKIESDKLEERISSLKSFMQMRKS